jgi:hypothetical protein
MTTNAESTWPTRDVWRLLIKTSTRKRKFPDHSISKEILFFQKNRISWATLARFEKSDFSKK